MSAQMAGDRCGNVDNPEPVRAQTLAEIHVFEPHRMETLVKTSDDFPGGLPDHEERAGGLVHIALLEIADFRPVCPVDAVTGPDSIQAQRLKTQCPCGWESANVEASLGCSVRVGQAAARRRDARLANRIDQRLQARHQNGVGIQQQNKACLERRDALVAGGRKSAVAAIGDETHARPATDLIERCVLRVVIYDDNRNARKTQTRVEAFPNDVLRIVGDHYDANHINLKQSRSASTSQNRSGAADHKSAARSPPGSEESRCLPVRASDETYATLLSCHEDRHLRFRGAAR